ncbi:hypothetical protein [Photobacterium galatheae]|uniref:Uncharacterized protein n=1 Tax=Photobacterium galatheae TaxID=1654360 RepID=A0A066RPA2_9GAMM|nr:hypothetical protein [Photobacterium galatheae]KDM90961.1 hypothetical protein EA58_14495 [Photobacterium galatheae]MCM0149081.1 hypothetical protein [Photobacterium galatheae]
MVGFVGLLSCALAAVFLVFVVMLLSFLQAQLAPTEGTYKLATESGLVFPIESHILTDEVFRSMMVTYDRVYGKQPVYISTSCIIGGMLDGATAKRYATYNFVFSKRKAISEGGEYDIAQIDSLPIMERESKLSSMCFIAMKTEELHRQFEEANNQATVIENE